MTVAIILAGGLKTGLMEDALVPVGKHYMVEYVVDALQGSTDIEKIFLSGPVQELKKIYAYSPDIELVANGATIVASFSKAFQLIPPETRQVLLVTGDIPLLTTEAVEHFLQTCRSLEGDLFYPIVSRKVNEEKYPGVKRTYIYLKEGVFTGGNIILLNSGIVAKCIKEAEELIRLRKKPLLLASYVGWKLLLAYVLRQLSLSDLEKEVSRLLGIKGVGVISPYPEIGIDVDKPSDLALVTKELC